MICLLQLLGCYGLIHLSSTHFVRAYRETIVVFRFVQLPLSTEAVSALRNTGIKFNDVMRISLHHESSNA